MEEQIITENSGYEEVLEFLNTYENIDDLLLDSLSEPTPSIKIISDDSEITINYDDFLEMFKENGLDALSF